MTNVSATRRAFEARLRTSPPATDDAREAANALRASLRNLERTDTPVIREFVAEDLARFEASLTCRHDEQS